MSANNDEKKEFWKTLPLVCENITLEELIKESQKDMWNNNKRFVFSVQWQFLPEKFQTDEKPRVAGVIWIKEKPNSTDTHDIKFVRKGL